MAANVGDTSLKVPVEVDSSGDVYVPLDGSVPAEKQRFQRFFGVLGAGIILLSASVIAYNAVSFASNATTTTTPASNSVPTPPSSPFKSSKAPLQSGEAPRNGIANGTCENTLASNTNIMLEIPGWLGVKAKRYFELYMPPTLDPSEGPRPVVFLWHGVGSTPDAIEVRGRMKPKFDENRWIGVYPKGAGITGGFNGAGCCPGSNGEDLKFAKAIVDFLETRICMDVTNVFSTGFSNGGFMTYRIGCEAGFRPNGKNVATEKNYLNFSLTAPAPSKLEVIEAGTRSEGPVEEKHALAIESAKNKAVTTGTDSDDEVLYFKALAVHSALVGVDYALSCTPVRKVPLIAFHATDDGVVGFMGGDPAFGIAWNTFYHSVHFYEVVNKCPPGNMTTDGEQVSTTTRCVTKSCAGGVPLKYCKIEDGLQHNWSGEPGKGHPKLDIDATAEMFRFFKELM